MKIISNLFATLQAQRHARMGVDGKDRYLTETIGLPPSELERGSYAYRTAVQQVADTGRVEELREDLRRGQDLQAIVGTPGLYTVGLVVVWGLEAAGSLLILRALGVPAEHRLLPAAALTLAMLGLTKVTVAATSAPSNPAAPPSSGSDPDPNPAAPAFATISWKRYLLPLVYGGLIAAVAASRVMGSDAADVPPVVALSEAVIMIAITCGPAFAAIWLEGKRAPALELARRVGLTRRRLVAEERRIRRADKFLMRVDRDQVRWTRENAELRAGYSTAHELALAQSRLDGNDDNNDAPDGNAPSNGR